MNKFLVTAGFLLLAHFAFAQTTTADSAETIAQSKSSKGSPLVTGGSEASISTTSQVPVPASTHKLEVSVYRGQWGTVDAINHNDHSADGVDLYAQAVKDIGGGQGLGLRVNAVQNQTNETRAEFETRISDPQIVYRNPFYGSTFLVSAPLSEVSQKVGRYEIRYNGGSELYDAGRFTLALGNELRGYIYTNDGAGQRYARYRGIVSPVFKLANHLTTITNVMYDSKWHKHGEGYGFDDPDANVDAGTGKKDRPGLWQAGVLDLGLSFQYKHLLVEPYVEQTQQLGGDDAWTFLNAKTTYYNLEITVTL